MKSSDGITWEAMFTNRSLDWSDSQYASNLPSLLVSLGLSQIACGYSKECYVLERGGPEIRRLYPN